MVQIAPSNSLKLMSQQGGEFWKYHYKKNARPARSHLQLMIDQTNPMRDCIVWKDVGDRDWCASVMLSDIEDVRLGPNSKTFLDNVGHVVNPNMCFSIYTRGRTLDLEAVHPEDLKVWINGLRYLVESDRRRFQQGGGGGGGGGGEWMNARQQGRGGGGILGELENHVDQTHRHGDMLEGIADWVAMKRRSGFPTHVPREPVPETLNVDQMFLAGPYRTNMPQPQYHPPAQPIPSQLPQSPYNPAHCHSPEFKQGFEEGRGASLAGRSG